MPPPTFFRHHPASPLPLSLPLIRRRAAGLPPAASSILPPSAHPASTMGNCLNGAARQGLRRAGAAVPLALDDDDCLEALRRRQDEEEENDDEDYDDAGRLLAPPPASQGAAAGLKVKVVLTRAELQWLMAQLKAGDQRRLEDVLQHLRAAKAAAAAAEALHAGWRPGLESILEGPET